MKEATGELNVTVIAVVAIAAVGAFFTIFILPGIRRSIALTSACNNSNNGMDTAYSDDSGAECRDGVCTIDGHSKTCNVENNNN